MDDVPSSGPEFFDIRYAAGRMPWDYGGVQNSLKAFLNRHHGPGHVLIPGCGSGYEIETFSSAGWDVIGIDYSAVGVARARRCCVRWRIRFMRAIFSPIRYVKHSSI